MCSILFVLKNMLQSISMKNKKTISKQLGISQKTIAELLMISRVQYALYETGKRDLPVTSKLQLAKMLSFNQEAISNDQEKAMQHYQTEKIQAIIDQEFIVNKHKQLLADKKLKKMEEKYYAALSALRLVRFLESETNALHVNSKKLLKSIKAKALEDMEKNGIHQQAKLQLKSEFLQFYNKELQSKLQNFKKMNFKNI